MRTVPMRYTLDERRAKQERRVLRAAKRLVDILMDPLGPGRFQLDAANTALIRAVKTLAAKERP